MKILAVAATELEIDAIQHITPRKGVSLLKEVVGVGQVATCFHLMDAIAKTSPDCIVQFGIAGAFSREFSIGDAVVVKSEIIGDMGVFENNRFHSIFDLNLQKENEFPYSSKQLINPHATLLEKTSLKKVTAISVNEITTSPVRMNYYTSTYSSDIESMEGAAFHYCCLMKKIPFVQIRGISNYVGERNKELWNIHSALTTAATSLQTFLSTY
ncbi:MAG: futalosine hydrolase [Chitinophagia bacterium]|jgi:futalosine hydrolase|nr:futalosine hydrolase [Chitinophagia bacterium]